MKTLQSGTNWSAESCAIIGITSPEGKKIYVAAFLPKGCGKTGVTTRKGEDGMRAREW
jgi:GTP-dependent phosphoenolpyruvate carboxykinase